MKTLRFLTLLSGALAAGFTASAQHLWWDLSPATNGQTALYGEITVLATHETTYYCGANWHPGEPAGGYCGIQHNEPTERRTIFSIWDTSPTLHPAITEADPITVCGRFGGEGEGGHTHALWDWQTGDTFQFFVTKQPGAGDTTDARYYVFDRKQGQWRHMATIHSPNGGHDSVKTLGGGVNSFLENFSGQDPLVPRLALYRLWLGPDAAHLKCLTHAEGDGTWGVLHDAYFLAAGGTNELAATFARLEPAYDKPLYGGPDTYLRPLNNRPVPPNVLKALQHLPQAPPVKAEAAK